MRSLKTARTTLPPCALARTREGLLIGTYELDKETGARTGSLDYYDADLALKYSVPTRAAVLDVKCHEERVYTGTSLGEVCVYDTKLNELGAISLGDAQSDAQSDALVTQLVLKDRTLAATLTSGELVVYDLEKETVTYRDRIHELEAWTVEFGGDAPETIYTGGDDRVLACTDLRVPFTLWRLKTHEAGVTSILPRADGTLWTGGYDDCVRAFDPRARRARDSSDLGGGVWRLLENGARTRVLACCMYGGLRVLGAGDFHDVRGSLTNHESMVYGGLWLSDDEGVTCSFYDKMLQTWAAPPS